MATHPWTANDEQQWTGERTLLRIGAMGAVVGTVLQVAAGTSQTAQLGGSTELALESLAGQRAYARFQSLDGHLPLADAARPTPYPALFDMKKMAAARRPQAIRAGFMEGLAGVRRRVSRRTRGEPPPFALSIVVSAPLRVPRSLARIAQGRR